MHYAIRMMDGSVAIMQTFNGATIDGCLAKWPPEERAKVVSHRPIDPAGIPQDRAFRNAWMDTGAAIVHDMAKARNLLRERLRFARTPLLAKLDVAYQRADETGDAGAMAAVVAQKQTLRDVTMHSAIEAAATVDELRNLTLATLAGV